jgi:hypothetical protein
MSIQILAKNILLQNDKYPDCVYIEYDKAAFAKCAVVRKTAKYLSGKLFIFITLYRR